MSHRFKASPTLSLFLSFVLALNFLISAPQVFAESSTSSSVGPQTPIGPQLPVGPTQPTGPQATPGPVGLVGPQSTPGPQGPTGPQAASPNPQVSAVADPASAPASSSSSSGTNSDTGASSNNQNSSSASSTQTADITNDAQISNDIDANLNTGRNTASRNTKVGGVETGDINGVVNVINVANSQFGAGSSVGNQSLNAGDAQTIALNPSATRTSLGSNSMTGVGSNNQNESTATSLVAVQHSNTAVADNTIGIQANTGANNLTQNTDAGDVETGDIYLGVNVINLLNLFMPETQVDVDIWSVLAAEDAVITVPSGSNSQTGASSNNQNSSNTARNRTIQVTQVADIDNDVAINANTGNNELSQNSTVGGLQNGETNIHGSVVNVANEPTLYIVNVFGEWNGSLQGVPAEYVVVNHFENEDTGANSSNTNSASDSSTSNYTLDNNATARNRIAIAANTGGNVVNQNTKVGGVKTGSINVLTNIVNVLNGFGGNLRNLRIGIINLFTRPRTPTQTAATVAAEAAPDIQTSVVEVEQPLTLPPNLGGAAAGSGSAAVGGAINQFVNSLPLNKKSASTNRSGLLAMADAASPSLGSIGVSTDIATPILQTPNPDDTITAQVVPAVVSERAFGNSSLLAYAADRNGASSTKSTLPLPYIIFPSALFLSWLVLEVLAARSRRRK